MVTRKFIEGAASIRIRHQFDDEEPIDESNFRETESGSDIRVTESGETREVDA